MRSILVKLDLFFGVGLLCFVFLEIAIRYIAPQRTTAFYESTLLPQLYKIRPGEPSLLHPNFSIPVVSMINYSSSQRVLSESDLHQFVQKRLV